MFLLNFLGPKNSMFSRLKIVVDANLYLGYYEPSKEIDMTRTERLNILAWGVHIPGSLWNRWIISNEFLNFEEFVEKYAPEELEGLTDE